MRNLVYGVGVNDADYTIRPNINGKQLKCPFYLAWTHMLARCYDTKYQATYPTYVGCTVCAEWLTFDNFKVWMLSQDWIGKQLDKDLLIRGNKIYSPDTCAFVDFMTNAFITDRGNARGDYPIGVSYHKGAGKFTARCCNPFTKKREHLGVFTCPNQAHLAWKTRKHELALKLADLQTDERVAKALVARYKDNNPDTGESYAR